MENETRGLLSVVGIGPGGDDHITPKALAAIVDADMVIGYTTYIRLVKHLIKDKDIIRTGMTEEIARARAAIEEAQKGKKVTLISSGDAGVYGMCGLVFQVLQEMGWTRDQNPQLNIVPGISALNSCGSLVGAPLGHDFCGISLSDLLTPWPSIRKKINCAADADFVIGLYNPASGRRTRQIVEAKE
ncbi:MAG: precorrin-3B C(17)-methyltransferase, partial [Lentisphaeraceae bacterium]|nr:precorrin-3B C(17)-methyltransferase [Lentisphaeraceae bacterium]